MRVSKKRPRGLVERTRPRPRGLHRSWLVPAWERAKQEMSALDPLIPEDFFTQPRNPLEVDIQTSNAMTFGIPLDELGRHWRLFASIWGRAQRRLDIAFKRDEERTRKQRRSDAMQRFLAAWDERPPGSSENTRGAANVPREDDG